MELPELIKRRDELIQKLAALKSAEMRILQQGQSITSQDGDASVQVNRVSFPRLCNEIRRVEGELAAVNQAIAHPSARRRSVNMRGV